MTRLVIVPFSDTHVGEAADLAADHYRTMRRALPMLPPRHEDPTIFAAKLAPLAATAAGFAALADGQLVGFMAGHRIPSFKGPQPGRYVPEWAHAGAGTDQSTVMRELYRAAAAAWVSDGCSTHAITLLAGDDAERETLFRLGFGMCTVDAVRGVDPVDGAPEHFEPDGITIRNAGPEDAAALAGLSAALHRHTASSPVLLDHPEDGGERERRAWLASPGHESYIALESGQPVAFMQCEPSTNDAAFIVSAPDTVAVTGAFVEERCRGRGIAGALLARIVSGARARGARRVSVDFESANAEAWSFWLRHFRPACWSLLRRVDERVRPSTSAILGA